MRNLGPVAILLIAIVIAALISGCNGNSPISTVVPVTGGHPATIDLSKTPGIAPFSEMITMPRNTELKLIANNEDTKIEEFDALHIASHMTGNVQETTFQTVNPNVKVGYGHSGTPLYTKDGRIIGAVYSGVDGSREVFVRSIEQMIPLLYKNTPMARSFSKVIPTVGSKWMLSGIPQSEASNLIGQKWSSKVEFGQKSTRSRQVETFKPLPGSTIAVVLVSGDDVQLTAYGTLTYSPDGGKKWVGFGHPLDQMGTRALPVFGASVDAVPLNAAFGTYKLCQTIGENPIGTLTGDHAEGIVVDTTKVPTMTPSVTKITINGKVVKESHQKVAKDFGSSLEAYAAEEALTGSLYNLDNQSGTWWATAELRYSIDGSPVTREYALPEDIGKGMTRGGIDQSPIGAKTISEIRSAIWNKVYNEIDRLDMKGKSFDSLSLTVDITSTSPVIIPVVNYTYQVQPKNSDGTLGSAMIENSGGYRYLLENQHYVVTAHINGKTDDQIVTLMGNRYNGEYPLRTQIWFSDDFWCVGEGGGTLYITVKDKNSQAILAEFPFNIYCVSSMDGK